MFVAMPYFVFMEAMMSPLIHGGTFLIFGEDGPCGPHLL